ncbi:MAG: DUF924 family protein [Pseudomonadota bacterium]
MARIDPKAQDVLDFWFVETTKEQRFKKDPDFDALIKKRFGDDVAHALEGGFPDWEDTPQGRLALIILLDQFTRNIYRNNPKTFAGDDRALALSQRAVADGDMVAMEEVFHRIFTLMPMMHSEDLAVQDASIPLFETHTDANTLKYAIAHRDIIARFGRFPHRNAVLGRESTSEEAEFLTQPGSSF